MHKMSNLNKFKDSYQVLEKKIQKFVSWEKKSSRTHQECLNNFFWLKIFITNTLCTNVYKMYECDKNQMPYYNVKCFKISNLKSFGPLIEHGPHWINFTILTFLSEKNRYFRGLYKIWNKINSLTWEKRWNVREEKSEFESSWSESLRFKCGTPIMLRV